MRRATLVIPADDQSAATAALAALVEGIATTFDVPLLAAPAGPVAAYWCSLLVPDAAWEPLAAAFDGVAGRRMFDGDRTTPDQVLAQCGLVRSQPAEAL